MAKPATDRNYAYLAATIMNRARRRRRRSRFRRVQRV